MNRCASNGCPNADLRLYKHYLRQKFSLLCGPCAASLSAIGLSLVERREVDLPVVHERRRSFRPRWLGRAKDLSDWRAA